MSEPLSEEQLFALTGYSDRGWLEKWLQREGIRYWRGRGGRLCTTTGLMEAAKLGKDAPREQRARPIRFAHGKT